MWADSTSPADQLLAVCSSPVPDVHERAPWLEPDLAPPPLTTLVVKAFPANCKVYLRKPGGRWKYVDDTPTRRRIAVGRYEVRVTLNPTGESRERTVELVAGDNPPVRVSFGKRS